MNRKLLLKVFKRVKHLWVLKFHRNYAFSAIASNGIIFENFQPMVLNYYIMGDEPILSVIPPVTTDTTNWLNKRLIFFLIKNFTEFCYVCVNAPSYD